ncbi:long form salivary protein D7L1-like [Ochlerotatus camptorhynchus]|uniref:long form salivary protein D7L1-like n=1 Tax=Ochlerotatus camptorhynchus TaxID=644619 RepID=UPI0031DE4610
MIIAKCLEVVAIFSWLSVVVSLEALDPEEALFINTRCLEDYAGKKDCLIKCILEKLGLYNPGTKKFEAELITKQQEKYPDLVPKEEADAYADAVNKLPTAENTCKAVYGVFSTILKQYKITSLNLFHENLEKSKKIYDELGAEIKQPGQSIFHFCENKFYPPGSPNRKEICEMRQFKVLDNEIYKKRVQCVYKGLRYITKDDKFDPSELKRDFKLAGKDTGRLDKVLAKCKSSEPKDPLPLARHYYKCLMDSEVVEDYKEAVDYREVRSMDYRYNIPKVRKYDKTAVAAQVKKLDAMQCPKA